MPRNLGRFGFEGNEIVGGNRPVIFDWYSLVIAPLFGFLLLAYYMTFKDIAPSFAQAAQIGALFGAIGMIMTVTTSLVAPDVVGRLEWARPTRGLQQYENAGLTLGILFGFSLVLQILILAVGKAQSVVTAPTSPWDTLFFYEAMAIMEEYFFRGFVFRAIRGLWRGNWIAGMIISSFAFGLYHFVVYQGDLFQMLAAGIGGAIYCVALQYSGRLSFSMALHQSQNFVASLRYFLP